MLRRRLAEAGCRARIAHAAATAGSEGELAERVSAELCEALEAEIAFLAGDGRMLGATGLTAAQAERVGRECPAGTLAWPGTAPLPAALAALAPEALALVAAGALRLGVVRLYAQPFDPAELALIESVAGTAASAHERRESERRYRLLADNSTDWISRLAPDGTFLYCSAACRAVTGYEPEELVGRNAAEFAHRKELTRTRRQQAELSRRVEPGTVTFRLRRKDGAWAWLESTARAIHDPRTGELAEFQASTRDVTARVAAEQELRLQAEIFRSMTDGVVLFRWRDARIVHANQRFERMFGYGAGELVGKPRGLLVYNSNSRTTPAVVAQAQAALERDGAWTGEIHNVRKDGTDFWCLATMSTFEHAEHGLVAVAVHTDITERKRAETQLQHLADHDQLTGLINRRRFEEELERELAVARRYGACGAVLVLDLDNFKYVNDALGHAAGDDLIAAVGQLLDGRLRESDVLARLGGDEFAAILVHADEARARAVAAGLVDAIRTHGAGDARPVTASIGIAPFGGGDGRGEQLLVEADIAMYDAKEAGRDRVAVFDPAGSRHAGMKARVGWSQRIRDALDHDRFVLHAQPIMGLSGDTTPRHELLLRMRGDDGELVAPARFLPVAERSGLIEEVDRWVLSQAIALLAGQQRAGRRLVLGVNLSARSVADSELPELIAAELAAAGADPAGLVFEITETAAILNLDRGKRFAERLHELGCGFALDDFGAGFASLFRLKHLACDYLKIDGEFVTGLTTNRTNQVVVESVVALARGLGKRTIAEFVSDAAGLALLGRYGVDYAQGFFVGRPVPLDVADLGAAPVTPSAGSFPPA